MKKVLTYVVVVILGVVVLSGCTKRRYYDPPIDKNKEVAYVDYFYDDYPYVFIVKFEYDGRYAIVTTLNEDEYLPILGERLIGNFSAGKKSIYVPKGNFYARVDVLETNIRTQREADNALAYWVDNDPYASFAGAMRSKAKPDIKMLPKR